MLLRLQKLDAESVFTLDRDFVAFGWAQVVDTAFRVHWERSDS